MGPCQGLGGRPLTEGDLFSVKSISVRTLELSAVDKIAEIDRSEHITRGYLVRNGELRSRRVDWDVPRWTIDGHADFNVTTRIGQLRTRLVSGDLGIAAFHGELLVGYIVLHERLTERMAQLSELFVSKGYRRRGIAGRLTTEVIGRARASGASQLYVSAVPSESAVQFYLSQGFRLAKEIHPDLYEQEPDDIHMVREL
jgi:GNAT superfamily N-acetyltransferase